MLFGGIFIDKYITRINVLHAIGVGVCAVVYSVILLLLKGVKKEEFEFFRRLFKV
jgi:hypothetical protein